VTDVTETAVTAATAADATDLAASTEYVLTVSCPDGLGIVAAITGTFAARGEFITESQQFGNPGSGRFFMRLQVQSTATRDGLVEALTPVFERFGMTWNLDVVGRKLRTVLMVSKAAHCLVDLLYRERSQGLPIDVVAVVGNHEDLRDIAEFYGKTFIHIPVTPDSKAAAEAQLRALVTDLDVELIVLARYMQILSDDLCRDLAGHVINIHHSFLPSFKGARPYSQAHKRGVKLMGATAHYVTGDLDEGPIIEQDVERVDHTRSVTDLTAMGADVERRTLARAVQWHAQHRVLLDGTRTVVFR
jgi:formyltetrahydrofolate deformylase